MNINEQEKPVVTKTLSKELICALAEISSLISESELSTNKHVRERIKALRSLVIEMYSQELPSSYDPSILKQLKPVSGEF